MAGGVRAGRALVVMVVAGCAALTGCTGTASPAGTSSAPAAPTTGASPAPTFAPEVKTACDEVASLIAAGELRAAERALEDGVLDSAKATCSGAAALIADRRGEAVKLVDAASVTPARSGVLARAAVRLDADNETALALLDASGATALAPGPTPSLAPSAKPPAGGPEKDACTPARDAVSEGRLAEASAVLDGLAEGEECTAAVKAQVAAAEAGRPLVRAWGSLSDDRLPQLLLAALLVLAGGFLARATSAGRPGGDPPQPPAPPGQPAPSIGQQLEASLRTARAWARDLLVQSDPRRRAVERPRAVWWGCALATLVLVPPLLALVPGFQEVLPGGATGPLWDTLTAVVALAFGFSLIGHLRATARTSIEVVDADGKTIDNAKLGTLVVSEVVAMAGSRPGGVFAVKGGTDVQDPAVNAALDAVTQSFLKTALTIWRALTTGLGDRVRISLVASDDDPAAAIVFRRGARVLHEERVDTHELRVARDTVSDTEKASVDLDLASAIAARLVLVSLGVYPPRIGGPPEVPGLNGVQEPRSLALCAVAARHSEAHRHDEAVELFARAHGIDPANRAARFGRAVNTLRVRASGADGLVALTDLEALAEVVAPDPDQPDVSALSWRCRYTKVIHRVNRILTGGVPRPGHPSRTRLAEYRQQILALVVDLDAAASAEDLDDGDPLDRGLASRLAVLARSVDCALRSLEEPDPVPIREALAATDSGSVAAMVNAANAYALLFRRSPGGGATRDLTSAVALMRLAGLEVGMRRDIVDDPVLQLLRKRKQYRALASDWGLGPVAPYSTLEAIGPDAAALLLQWYPTELKLLQAARRNPQVVATRGDSGLHQVPWWVGALEWVVAGRDVAVINAYQAAGIRDAAQAGRIGDAQVVWRLKVRQEDDRTLAIPDARTRALMVATT